MNLSSFYGREKVQGYCCFCHASYIVFTEGTGFPHTYTELNIFSCPKCDRCVAVKWMNNRKWVKKIKVNKDGQ